MESIATLNSAPAERSVLKGAEAQTIMSWLAKSSKRRESANAKTSLH
jgi:hypothetical protein